MASARAIPDDLVSEILARLPADTPEYLLRASLVCKSWIRLTSDPAFHRLLHKVHGSPPLLGFLLHGDDEPNFVRDIAFESPITFADVPDRLFWRVLDYRHGRAIYVSTRGRELLVWELLTGDKQRVQLPAACESDIPGAAVFCAARRCDHDGGCDGGHFQVALVFSGRGVSDSEEGKLITKGCLFSSETGTWSNIVSVNNPVSGSFGDYSSVFVKDESMVYFFSNERCILEYDISAGSLSILEPPNYDAVHNDRMLLMVTKHGALGVAEQREENLVLWSRKQSDTGEKNWVETSNVHIGLFSLLGCTMASSLSCVLFIGKTDGLYRIDLHSNGLKETKVYTERQFYPTVPIFSFYTPKAPSFILQGIEDEHPALPSTASEQVGQEREGETELAQQFDNESVGMKRANDADSESCSKRVALP